jgi:hypothetical protein
MRLVTVYHYVMHAGCESLISLGSSSVCVNIKNLEGKTAWDILQEQTQVNREMKVKLRRAKALIGSSLPTVTSYADYLMQPKVRF